MSDYLNNIVSRSLSVADVVQPRVPHLFEQTAAAIPVDVAPAPTGENAVETMIVAGEVQPSTYTPPPPSPVNPEVATPFFEQFRPAPVQHAPLATPMLQEPSSPIIEVTSRNADPEAVNESAMHARSVPERAPVTQQPRTVNHNDDRIAGAMLPSRVGPVTQSEPSVAVHRSDPVSPNTRNSSISQAVPAARPQQNLVEQQLPPIKINIGRVDVRAIMPAAAPVVSHSARPKPALSLESYLKQREEGKR